MELLPFYRDMPDTPGLKVEFFRVGSRLGRAGALCFPRDFGRFVMLVLFARPDAVLLNPSLQPKALLRDGIFAVTCRFLMIPTFVLFHG